MLSRLLAACALGSAIVLPAGAEPADTAGRPTPTAMVAPSDVSFESRCARLPPSEFEVTATPITFERDETRTMAELSASGSTPVTHHAIGLTSAVFGQRTRIETHLVVDPRDGCACGTPSVHVELSMQPVVVFLASELAETPCQHEAAFSHEMKHVAIFREALEQAAKALQSELADALGATLCYATSSEGLQRQIHGTVYAYLWRFMRGRQDALDVRQAEVDSPDEYARVHNACAPDGGDH